MIVPRSVKNLIEALERLPGIGPKTAARLTFYLLHVPESEIDALAEAVGRLKKDTVICQACFNVAEKDPCVICSSPQRERSVLAVVESPLDVLALEKAGFRGLYHVLHGAIDPLNNIGPEELKIKELLRRVDAGSSTLETGKENGNWKLDNSSFKHLASSQASSKHASLGFDSSQKQPQASFGEIILATNPSVEGEATAMYIKRALSSLAPSSQLKITRLARGLPVGGDLEYADDVTLGKAIEGRTEY